MRFNGGCSMVGLSVLPLPASPKEWRISLTRELGDFQTPPALVATILECLNSVGGPWLRALEPTCGRGNFIEGLLNLPLPPHEIQAIELQDVHVASARRVAKQASITHVIVKKG